MKLDDYELLLIGYAREITAYLIKGGANPAHAQEISQDVLLQMLEADLLVPPEKMRAWMYRTAIRRYIDNYRRDKRYYDILQKHFFTPETLVTYDQDDYGFLYDAIAELAEDDQLLLDLYYFQGFLAKEIQEITGFSYSHVKIKLMRARQRLKTILTKAGYHHDIL
ncbi:RNA polymerase sigma factor [Streptococcus caprae]|uniref:RNA polymerase sigma factor n=1 Tax=Streptococcus caprae TaxID=1640501 RepID=A0ABV8CU26_9STRE